MTVDREAVIAYLREHPHLSNQAICRQFPGANKDSVAKWRYEAGIPNPHARKAGDRAITPAEPDPEEAPALPPVDALPPPPEHVKSSIWKSLEWYQHEVRSADPRVEEASVTLPDNAPVLVAWTSDWHLGHIECRMDRLRHDLELAARTPGVYLGAGGDLIDNTVSAVAARGMLFESMAPPQVQMYLLEEAAAIVPKDRWLFVCLGNHEAWSVNNVDYDPMAHFARHIDTVYFGAWGYLHVTVGQQRYDILAGHKFSGNSKVNKTGMVKNAMNLLGDADIVFAGHTHTYASEISETRRRERFYAVAGTYLQTSRFGQMLGYPHSSPKMPGAILFPDERRFIATSDAFGQGIHVLASFRDDVICECKHCTRRRKDAA